MSVDQRRVPVTGGSGFLGKAIAEEFERRGARVVLADVAVSPGARDAVHMDVTSMRSVGAAVAEARQILGGTIEVLVNAAGVASEAPFLDTSEEIWKKTLEIDLLGIVNCCRAVMREMSDSEWGRVINIASQIGIKGGAGLSAYASAKGAVVAFTRSLALEYARHNVLVNAIAPGPIESPMVQSASREWREGKVAELPLGRFGTAQEVAPTAILLASDPGGNLYVGQTLGPNSGDIMP